MIQEFIFKIITSLFAVISAGKIIYDISLSSKTRLRDEYRFSIEFFSDLKEKSNLHPLSVEKGYQAIAGTSEISSNEVSYLLSLKKPSNCLKNYVFARDYLEYVENEEANSIIFAKKYRNKFVRKILKIFHIILYFIFAFIAISPLLFSNIVGIDIFQSITISLITLPIFGYCAFNSMQCFAKLIRSEQLVNSQPNPN